MLRPILHRLAGRKVILASTSPRRKGILEHINFPFEVIPSSFEENLDKSKFSEPWQYAVENAKGKAWDVAKRIEDDDSWQIIIGADTIVVKDGVIFEKPITPERAREMLHNLQGSSHTVITGVVLVFRSDQTLRDVKFHETTMINFAPLTDEIIEAYVDSKEPLDKAGAYGIQDLGGTLVESINGDFYNVVGLPLPRLCTEIMKIL